MFNTQNRFCNENEKIGRNLFRQVFNNKDKYRIYFADYEMDEVDFIMIGKEKAYAGDIKAYRNPQHPRPHNGRLIGGELKKYDDYEIDFSKLENIEKRAKQINGVPILVVFFSDQLMIWELDKIDWRATAHLKEGNKYGSDTTIKEKTLKASLYYEDAVYKNNKIRM